MSLPGPIDLQRWVDEHRELLKPPVGNKCIVDGDYIVMIVGGPNARTDYHFEEGPEFFYQLEGEMVLRVQEDGAVRDIAIQAGEMFYLPPRVPLLPTHHHLSPLLPLDQHPGCVPALITPGIAQR